MSLIKRYWFKIVCSFTAILVIVGVFVIYTEFFKDKVIEKNGGKIKIGFSIDSLVVERWQYDRDIFLSKAKELGAEVLVQNASNDSNEQINQIRFLIDQDIDVLVIVPNDSEALAPVVKSARDRGIKVISYDRLIKNAKTDLYVCFDNEAVGKMMAGAIVKKVPSGNYIIINGSDRDNNAVLFNRGFKDILKPYIDRKEIKIVKEVWANNWREEDAYECVEDVLSNGTHVDGIIAANDLLAEAAIQILAEHRLAGKVAVVGQDAELSGCQRVAEGMQLMTVYKSLKLLAQNAAIAAVNMAKGIPIKNKMTMNDGTYNIPVMIEPSTPVNKDNMVDVIVKNNFHRLEDIYRNIPKSIWPKVK